MPFIDKVIEILSNTDLFTCYLSSSKQLIKEQREKEEGTMRTKKCTTQVSQTKKIKFTRRLSDLLKVLTFGPPPNKRLPYNMFW